MTDNLTLTSFHRLVDGHPEKITLIDVDEAGHATPVSWDEFDRASNQVARMLVERGVQAGDTVILAVRNCAEHYFVTWGAWKIGALALPLRAETPARERDAILELAQPAAVYAEWPDLPYPTLTPADLEHRATYDDSRLPITAPFPGKAIASGGSTGRPKIVLDPAWTPVSGGSQMGMAEGQVQLMAAPLYHNSPTIIGNYGLMRDHTIVIMRRFIAELAVELIEHYRVNYAYLPPIIMQRIARLPDIAERDLSSLEAIHSSAAVCPDWLKRAWIDLIGAEHVWEVYGSSEGVCRTIIRGDEWLEHPGSVGKPVQCELRILDEAGNALPAGEVGEIFSLNLRPTTFSYRGAPPLKQSEDGFVSVGDLGWLDGDGYLYIADRRTDMIVSGGANIYPAEVESALGQHPGVDDVVVVGVPDDEWGRRVHAIIQPADFDHLPSIEQLNEHVRQFVTSYKAPKTYEFLRQLPRNEAGKIRRSQLAAEREGDHSFQMLPVRKNAPSSS